MKRSGSKAELVRLLVSVWPKGEDDLRTARCSLCKVSILLREFVEHFKLCKEDKECREKQKSEPFKIPKVVNTFDNLIRRKNSISAFKSSDLGKKNFKKSKTFKTPFKEGIKIIIRGAGSR